MALVSCPECEHKVSEKAISCPSCGYPFHQDSSEVRSDKGRSKKAKKARYNQSFVHLSTASPTMPGEDENIGGVITPSGTRKGLCPYCRRNFYLTSVSEPVDCSLCNRPVILLDDQIFPYYDPENPPFKLPKQASPFMNLLALGIIIAIYWVFFAVACRKDPTQEQADNSTVSRQQAEITVSSSSLGSEWPLTVDSGTIRCQPKGGDIAVVTFMSPDGHEYALNGIAKSHGYPDIAPIWQDNYRVPGAKVSISTLISMGLKLCT